MRMNQRRAGFTLIELMVVVIIIAALAGMVLPRLMPVSDQAKSKIALGDIANISVALKLYRLHNDRYPTAEEGLAALVPQYLEKAARDPWKNEYKYAPPKDRDGDCRIWSMGADGQDTTGDDVRSWEE